MYCRGDLLMILFLSFLLIVIIGLVVLLECFTNSGI